MPPNDLRFPPLRSTILDGLQPLDAVHGENIQEWNVFKVYTNDEQTKYVLEIRREVDKNSWQEAFLEIEGRLTFTPTAIKIGLGTKLTKLGVTHNEGGP